MKILVFLLIPLLLVSYIFYLGNKSVHLTAPQMSDGKLPQCGSKPNCVCSEQTPSDSHYIEPIALNSNTIDSIAQAVESLGGVVVDSEEGSLHATFTSGIFRFVDDVLLRIDNGQIHIRSSSRVGYGDLEANKKRVEQLRSKLN